MGVLWFSNDKLFVLARLRQSQVKTYPWKYGKHAKSVVTASPEGMLPQWVRFILIIGNKENLADGQMLEPKCGLVQVQYTTDQTLTSKNNFKRPRLPCR